MLQRIIDDLNESSSAMLRQALLMAAVALALFTTIAFLCAAAFVFVLENYGPVEACIAGAGIFLIVAVIAAGLHAVRRRQIEDRARQRAKAATHSLLADPVLVATSLHIARAIGVKRLVPLLAVGGLALGIMASRNTAQDQVRAE